MSDGKPLPSSRKRRSVATTGPRSPSPTPAIGPGIVAHRGADERATRERRRAAARQPSLLRDEAFLTFWLSRLLTQAGQGAIVYGLLIIIVDRTDASFFNSLFVVCAILPSLAFGIPAGVAVDALPRRPLLITLNLLRFAFALALVANEPSIPGIFAASLGIWTIHQFYSPAEASLLPSLVPRHRLTAAQALSNLALTLAQALGLVILAPLLLKTTGPPALFALCGALFVVATLLVALLPARDEHLRALGSRRPAKSIRQALAVGWQTARNDPAIYEVITTDVLVGIGLSALVVIIPLYLKGVLNTAAENTVFVFAPAALGLLIGLRVSPTIVRWFGGQRIATWGLMLFAACVAAFGFIAPIRAFLNETLGVPTDRIAEAVHVQPLVLIVMALSVPAGFASSVVSVSARSVILRRTPAVARGQVIATQSLIQNLGALVPTLLAGVAADIFGVERVAVAIAAMIAGGAIAALTKYRPTPVPPPTRRSVRQLPSQTPLPESGEG